MVATADEQGNPIVPYLDWLGARIAGSTRPPSTARPRNQRTPRYTLKTAPSAKPRQLVTDIESETIPTTLLLRSGPKPRAARKVNISQVYSLDLEDEQSIPLGLVSRADLGRLRLPCTIRKRGSSTRDVDFPNLIPRYSSSLKISASAPVSVKRGERARCRRLPLSAATPLSAEWSMRAAEDSGLAG